MSILKSAPIATLLLLGACSSERTSKVVTIDDCQEVRQHKAELRMVSFRPAGLNDSQVEEERAKHLQNFATLGGQRALDECVATKSLAWVECSMMSKSLPEAAACNSLQATSDL